ncbi:MAG: ABC transporter substrate-binding protein [Leptospirales bacterium]
MIQRAFCPFALLLSGLLLFGAGGCSGSAREQWKVVHRGNITGGQLVMDVVSDPRTFNPALASETTSTQILGYLFRGLTRISPHDGSVKPDLAKDWKVSRGGRRVVFHLLPGLLWSDGVPLDGRDVVFSFEKIYYNPSIATSVRSELLVDGKPISVSLRDPLTVVFETSKPFAPLLESLGVEILPRHILEPIVDSGKFNQSWSVRENPSHIVGTGPFILEKYAPGQFVVLSRNPLYRPPQGVSPSPGCTMPCLSKIVLRIVPNDTSSLIRFLTGKTDLFGVTPQQMAVLKPEQKPGAFRLMVRGPSLSESFVTFNENPRAPIAPWKLQWFRNRRFREAVAWSIDRTAMINIVLNGMGSPIPGPVPSAVRAFFNDRLPPYGHDPARARLLLKKAGFSYRGSRLYDGEGHRVIIILLTNTESPERIQMAQILQANLKDVGIKIRIVPLQFNMLATMVTSSYRWEMLLFGLTGVLDPHGDTSVWKSSGFLHLWNPREPHPDQPWEAEIDQLFDQGATTMDPVQRKKIYDRWQEIAHRELPLIDLVTPDQITGVRKTLGGIHPTPLGGVVPHISQVFQSGILSPA